MKSLVRSLVVTLAAGAALSLAGTASAAPVSTSFSVVGYEYAFTQTVGSFAGSATGNAGDHGAWNARVEHDPLGSMPTYINGGTITILDPGANCTNQRFLVAGRLQHVETSTTSGGTGLFSVTLTHYRYSLLGHCVIYAARVVGRVSFVY